MGRLPGPEESSQKPLLQARPGSLGRLLPLPVTQVPGTCQGPPESTHATAPGLGEHAWLAQQWLTEPTQPVLPKTTPVETAELNGAASLSQ